MPKTLKPFSDEPAPTANPDFRALLALAEVPGGKPTSAQRNFRDLIARIESSEAQLLEINSLAETFRRLYDNKLSPLQAARDAMNREMILFLDESLMRKKWSATQGATIEEILCSLAARMVDGEHDAEMVAILERYSNADDDLDDPPDAEFVSELERVLEGDFAAGTRTKGDDHEPHDAKPHGGKKSKGQQKTDQQAIDAGKLLKEIYRRLTSAIHPDREPDDAERIRKTALMAEANKAYESGNLLKLLQLQMLSVKIDPRAAAGIADEKLRLINLSLVRQFGELQNEILHCDAMIRAEFHVDYFRKLDAQTLQKILNATAATARADNKILRQELTAIRRDEAEMRRWLKDQRRMMREGVEDIDAALDEMMVNMTRRR